MIFLTMTNRGLRGKPDTFPFFNMKNGKSSVSLRISEDSHSSPSGSMNRVTGLGAPKVFIGHAEQPGPLGHTEAPYYRSGSLDRDTRNKEQLETNID